MLVDHFHPPLSNYRHWTGFHSRWAGNIAAELNTRLSDRGFAEPTVHWSIDVATFEEAPELVAAASGESELRSWNPPAPARSIPFSHTTDVVEVRVFEDFGDRPLVAAIEFASPANKDRPDSRDAFAAKCESYLRDGIGLVIVDVVTERRASLHVALMQRCGAPSFEDSPLYVSGYRPVSRNTHWELDIWHEELHIGGELPPMPLCLKDGPCIEVNLADTYRQTYLDLKVDKVLSNN